MAWKWKYSPVPKKWFLRHSTSSFDRIAAAFCVFCIKAPATPRPLEKKEGNLDGFCESTPLLIKHNWLEMAMLGDHGSCKSRFRFVYPVCMFGECRQFGAKTLMFLLFKTVLLCLDMIGRLFSPMKIRRSLYLHIVSHSMYSIERQREEWDVCVCIHTLIISYVLCNIIFRIS